MTRPIPRAVIIPLSLVLGISAGVAVAEPDFGAYLAARQARLESAYGEAVHYYGIALARDPKNPALMENALVADIGLGNLAKGIDLARRLIELEPKNQVAHVVLLAADFKAKNFAAALKAIDAERGVGPLVDGLLRGWAEFGLGNMNKAIAAFDATASDKSLASFAYFHKALALAATGDFGAAAAILSGKEHGPLRLSPRGVLAYAEVLAQLERNQAAITILQKAQSRTADAGLAALEARLIAGKSVPYDFVTSPSEGASEVFFTLAAILEGQASVTSTMIYSRVAEYLWHENVHATLMSAELLEKQQRFDLAAETYGHVPSASPYYPAAQIGRANALFSEQKKDAAVEVLKTLAGSHPKNVTVQAALGDTLRRMGRHSEAIAAYDAAIALSGQPPKASEWFLYYARGISEERTGAWTRAEPDFRAALKLRPNAPLVLNYLGYALIERGTRLDEALGMIKKAVAGRPDDGYITDSLGWAYYRLGRFSAAIKPMEHAVELLPLDPIVNDHLGDVYWKVGRRREAVFQWKRALSFGPEKADAERIRRKLAEGLDAVLKSEARSAHAVATNGN